MNKTTREKSLLVLLLGLVFLACTVGDVQAQATYGPLWDSDLLITANSNWDKADVAFDGERYLVVWAQFGDSYNDRDIYGCFVNAFGKMTPPFALADNVNTQWEPGVAFNGTAYFVVWHQRVYEETDQVNSIRGRLVDKQGNLSPEVEIHSSSGSTSDTSAFPDVASDGNEFWVVWREWLNFFDYDIYGRKISAEGIPLGDEASTIYGGTGRQDFPTVCFGSPHCLVTWISRDPYNSYSDIYGTFTGAVPDFFPITIATGNQGSNAGAGLAFGDANFLVAWDNDPDHDIHAGIFTPGGELQPPVEMVIEPNSDYGGRVLPQVGFDGTDWLVVWGGYKIRGTRVTQAGGIMEPDGFDINKNQTTQLKSRPSVAFGNQTYLVTWTDQPTNSYLKFAQLVGQKLPVRIDIKPGSYPNSINLGSEGKVAVAIFSSNFFDATQVDPGTIYLASAGVGLRGKSEDNYMASCEDVDGDGLLDLIVHVETEALSLSATDVETSLTGSTLDGRDIEGKDSVRVVQE